MTLPFYPFYWSDYSGKCFHLSQGQHGAYFLLLRYIYTTGEKIPHELRYSIAKALLEQEQRDTDIVLQQFFYDTGGKWGCHKADEVMKEAHEQHEKRVNAGRKGAEAKLKPGSSNAPATKPKPITKSLGIKPQTPLPVDKNGDGFENLNGGKKINFDIHKYLDDRALESAKNKAPGWDIYFLIKKYNDGHGERGMPDNPAGAFIAWCGKYTKGKTP